MKIISKSAQVEAYLHDGILGGKWRPGTQLPSESELCLQLGVSPVTLKNVMSRLACDGLIVRKQKLGTFVAEHIAPKNIGILIKSELIISPESFFYRAFSEGIHRLVSACNLQPLIITEYGDNLDTLGILLKNAVGVIDMTQLEHLHNFFESKQLPWVSVVTEITPRSDMVTLDYRKLISMAKQVMRDYGYDDFAVMCQYRPDTEGKPSQNAYWEYELVDNDLSRLIHVPWEFDCRNAYEEFKTWWNGKRRRKAIFFFDDGVFDVASRAILELGIKVPDELVILTHANANRHFHFPVDVARLEFDPTAIASAAWHLLQKNMASRQQRHEGMLISPVFVPGSSLTRK